MISDNPESRDEMYEYKMLLKGADGFTGQAWFHRGEKLGVDKDLDIILTDQSAQGWNLIHIEFSQVLLRRKAR